MQNGRGKNGMRKRKTLFRLPQFRRGQANQYRVESYIWISFCLQKIIIISYLEPIISCKSKNKKID